MSITGILIAAAWCRNRRHLCGTVLGVAGIKFKVEVDEKEEAVLAAPFPEITVVGRLRRDVPVWQLPLQRRGCGEPPVP